MQPIERYLPWSIRILIAALFLVSAYGKVYPDPSAYGTISMFEIKQLYPLGFSAELAKIFSRSLIGVEFALGLLLLFPFDLKKWVIPALIAMLSIFVVHLTIEIFTTGNKGNCGCFGALLPMTPLEAIMKNVLSIGLLALLWKRYGAQLPERSNIWFLTTILSLCMLLMFIFVPTYKAATVTESSVGEPGPDTTQIAIGDPVVSSPETIAGTTEISKDTTKTKPKDIGPKAKSMRLLKLSMNCLSKPRQTLRLNTTRNLRKLMLN